MSETRIPVEVKIPGEMFREMMTNRLVTENIIPPTHHVTSAYYSSYSGNIDLTIEEKPAPKTYELVFEKTDEPMPTVKTEAAS